MAPLKILLCFPPFSHSAFNGPHLAPPLLAAILKREGMHSTYTDLNILTIRRLLEQDLKAELLGVVHSERSNSYTPFDIALAQWLQNSNVEEVFHTYPYSLRHVLHLIRRALFPQPNNLQDISISKARFGFWRKKVYKEILQQLSLDKIDSIGFSIAFGEQVPECLFIANLIRETYSHITTIIGGSQLTLLSNDQIDHIANTDLFDRIVVGNAEKEISSVVGTSHDKVGSKVIRTRPLGKKDLLNLPVPEFNPDEMSYYFGPLTLPVLLSKGCYWGKCTFCDYAKMNVFLTSKYITRPTEDVLSEIESYSTRNIEAKFLLISDAVSPAFYKRLAQMAIDRGVPLKTWSYMMNYKGLDHSFFQLLADAGVSTVNFGSETTCDRILKKMNKPARRVDIIRNINDAHRAGIKVVMNTIVDFPGITFNEAIEVADDIIDLSTSITVLNPQLFDLTDNTALAKYPNAFELELLDHNPIWSSHGYHSLRFQVTKGLSTNQRESVISIFQTLASKKRVRRRAKSLRLPTDDKDVIAFDRSALLYYDQHPIVDIVSLRYRWSCPEDEWNLFGYIFELPHREIALYELRNAWKNFVSKPYDGSVFEVWLNRIMETGVIEKVNLC